MECALVCPDAAIPNNVHDIHELLTTAIHQLDVAEAQKEAMREHVYTLAEALREMYRQTKQPRPLHEMVAEAASTLDTDKVTVLKRAADALGDLKLLPGPGLFIHVDVVEVAARAEAEDRDVVLAERAPQGLF